MNNTGERARSFGRIATGAYRVVVLEADLRVASKDFKALADAKAYADDAASESDDTPAIAKVFDARFRVVHEGRAYFLG